MVLFLLAFLGGALTIVSLCILPVLPFVFARADRPFSRNGLRCSLAWPRLSRGERAGGGRWRLGRRSQSIRARHRDRPSGAVRPRAAVPRVSDRMTGRSSRSARACRKPRKKTQAKAEGPSCRRCSLASDRPAGRHARGRYWVSSYGRRPQWGERANLAAAGRLRRRRRDVARARLARRRADFRRDEAVAWGRRMDTSRAWRRRARLQRRDRLGSRLRASRASLASTTSLEQRLLAEFSLRGDERGFLHPRAKARTRGPNRIAARRGRSTLRSPARSRGSTRRRSRRTDSRARSC